MKLVSAKKTNFDAKMVSVFMSVKCAISLMTAEKLKTSFAVT
jgi:hypothetical protein